MTDAESRVEKCGFLILADDKAGVISNNNTIYANHFIITKTTILKFLSNVIVTVTWLIKGGHIRNHQSRFLIVKTNSDGAKGMPAENWFNNRYGSHVYQLIKISFYCH